MSRTSYKTALRAKGFKPLPVATRLRSSLTVSAPTIDATSMAQKERTQ